MEQEEQKDKKKLHHNHLSKLPVVLISPHMTSLTQYMGIYCSQSKERSLGVNRQQAMLEIDPFVEFKIELVCWRSVVDFCVIEIINIFYEKG